MEPINAQWYCVELTPQQLAAGEKRRLAKQATEIYLAQGKPEGFALFATGLNQAGHATVYFSPGASSRLSSLMQAFHAKACPKPANSEELAVIAGDLSEKHKLFQKT